MSHMNLAPFVPLIVGLLLSVISTISSREGIRQNANLQLEFHYPRSLRYALAICSLVVLIVPPTLVLTKSSVIKGTEITAWIVALVGGCICLATLIWATKYRVILEESDIQAGAFFKTRIEFSRITRVVCLGIEGTGQLKIWCDSGKCMRISAVVGNFAHLVDEVERRLPRGIQIEFRPERWARYWQDRKMRAQRRL